MAPCYSKTRNVRTDDAKRNNDIKTLWLTHTAHFHMLLETEQTYKEIQLQVQCVIRCMQQHGRGWYQFFEQVYVSREHNEKTEGRRVLREEIGMKTHPGMK